MASPRAAVSDNAIDGTLAPIAPIAPIALIEPSSPTSDRHCGESATTSPMTSSAGLGNPSRSIAAGRSASVVKHSR